MSHFVLTCRSLLSNDARQVTLHPAHRPLREGRLVLGLNRAVLAEGLAFAQACGLDLNAVLEILRSGAAYSRAMDTKGRKMIEADFAPEAKLAQHLKDVHLILETSDRIGATTPLSHLHEELLSVLVQQGLGDDDNSCVIRAFPRRHE